MLSETTVNFLLAFLSIVFYKQPILPFVAIISSKKYGKGNTLSINCLKCGHLFVESFLNHINWIKVGNVAVIRAIPASTPMTHHFLSKPKTIVLKNPTDTSNTIPSNCKHTKNTLTQQIPSPIYPPPICRKAKSYLSSGAGSKHATCICITKGGSGERFRDDMATLRREEDCISRKLAG